MVGPIDARHDLWSQLLSAPPVHLVKHVLLQQGEDRHHRGPVTVRLDSDHAPGDALLAELSSELPRTGLRAAVRLQRRSIGVTESDRVAQCRDGQLRGRSGVDRAADDSVQPEAFDRAQVELAFICLPLSVQCLVTSVSFSQRCRHDSEIPKC